MKLGKQARWVLYEAVIADLEEKHEDCKVIRNHTVIGRHSGVPRQVDVWIEALVGGLDHRVSVAVECKAYSPKNKIGIKDMDAFHGFLEDVQANKGVLVTTSDFTRGARARAKGSRIDARVLSLDEALEFSWSDYLLEEACQTYWGCFGTVGWSYSEDPADSAYGFCDRCGTLHIRCGYCDLCDIYLEGEDILQCANDDCRAQFVFSYHKGEIEGFDASLRDDDDDLG